MIVEEARASRLATFLDRRGMSEASLRAQVEEAYGTPLLVVATGSVLEGFGNERSDVDLSVVVDRESLTQLPIMSYPAHARVDATYYRAADLRGWIDLLRDGAWPPPGRLTRDLWLRRFRVLKAACRFADGLVLTASGDWSGWVAELRRPWLAGAAAAWWRTDALRYWLTARWLAAPNPLLAAQRACDAVLAALEGEAAARGQLYLSFNPRWLPEKLRALGDTAGLELVRRFLRTPVQPGECAPYLAACDELLRERLGPLEAQPVRAQVWYAAGVRAHELDARVLVTRWGLRGVELRGERPPAPDGTEPLWEGPPGAPPPAAALELFAEDMTWLALAAR